jgi:hypothetical protein
MHLMHSQSYRLFDVSDEMDASGHYGLAAFANTAYNEVIDEEELDDTLCELADVLFGESGCRYYPITDDVQTAENGKLSLDLGNDEWLEVRDIVDKIDVDPEKSLLFVLVNLTRTECQWVAAVPEGTVYSA